MDAQTSDDRTVCQASPDHHNAAPCKRNLIPQIAALVAMLPLTAAAIASRLGRNLLLWLLLAAALAGPAALVASPSARDGSRPFRQSWSASPRLCWPMAGFVWFVPVAYRLGALLLPYLALSAVLAIGIFRRTQRRRAGDSDRRLVLDPWWSWRSRAMRPCARGHRRNRRPAAERALKRRRQMG